MASPYLRDRSLRTRISLLMLVIVLSSLWSLALYARAALESDVRHLVAQQQRSTARFIAQGLESELQRRLQSLEQLARRIPTQALTQAAHAQAYLEENAPPPELFNGGVALLDTRAVVVADTLPDTGRIGQAYSDHTGVMLALQQSRSNIGPPSVGRKLGTPLFPVSVPVRGPDGTVWGALVGITQIDQASFLEPIRRNRYGESGEVFLVDRARRTVITANDPRFTLKALVPGETHPEVERYLAGEEGVATFVDPQGVEVQTVAQQLQSAPWFLAIKLPTEEALGPIRALQTRFMWAATLVSLLALLLTRWMLGRHLAPALSAVRELTQRAETGESSTPLPVAQRDEIGRLIHAFNRLMGAQARHKALLREVLNTSNVGIFTTDTHHRITFANDTMGQLFGEDASALVGREYIALVSPKERAATLHNMNLFSLGEQTAIEVHRRFARHDGSAFWGKVSVRQFHESAYDFQGTVGVIADVSEQIRARDHESFRRLILERLASDAPLNEVFLAMARGLEQLRTPARASVLLLSADGLRLERCVAPSMPAPFLSVIDGQAVAAQSLACGCAAYLRRPVAVGDVLSDPGWAEVLAQAQQAGVRACWSQPILGADAQVLGTIALYLEHPTQPSPEDKALMEQAAQLAALALTQKQAHQALVDSEERYRAITEWTPTPMVVHRRGILLFVNPAMVQLLGEDSAQDMVGRNALQWVHPDSRAQVLERVKKVGEEGADVPAMLERYVRRDGAVIEVLAQAKRIVYDGAYANLVCATDVSERQQSLRRLQLAAQVFDHAREGIMVTQPDGTIVEVNAAFERITGYERSDVLGRNPRILSSGRQGAEYYRNMWRSLQESGNWSGEVWNRRKSGELYAEMQTISTVFDTQGRPANYVSLFSDVTVAKEHAQRMERIAHYDSLTNLPNRVLLSDRLHQAMVQSQRRGTQTAVAFLDLDGFKAVNDLHGHDIGDQLLVCLAQRMRQALREGDTLARLGGDEFVAVMVDLPDPAASAPLLRRLLEAAAEPVTVQEHPLQVSASLGVTFYPQTEEVDADQLMRQADQAMYQAKVAGKNRFHIFDAEQDRHVRGHHEHLDQIRTALANDEFVLHYQPKVNMHTGRVVGVEALIRWQHPQRGLLAPGTFLPVVENTPLAVEVGDWVLAQALAQQERWLKAGLSLCLSVNVGAGQLQQSDFVPKLRALLGAHPSVPPALLELEVLETSALEDMEHICAVIRSCSDMGIAFALDDFGTGYSSLAYLKQLPAQVLKIDQGFVRDMLDDPDDLAILDGVIGLASAFRREVIAEGVESVAHGTMLLQLGCTLGQGYGIARPMPADALGPWVAQWKPDPAWTQAYRVHREDFALLYVTIEHRVWCREIERVIEGLRLPMTEVELRDCRFGRWLHREGAQRYSAHPAYLLMDTAHERLHDQAKALHRLAVQGQTEAARAGLPALHTLQDALSAQIEKLLLAPPGASTP